MFTIAKSFCVDSHGSLIDDLENMGSPHTVDRSARAGQILRGMLAFHDCVAFTMGWGVLGGNGDGG